jgi:hypothetical protein
MNSVKEQFLQDLAAENGGRLTASQTVDAARDPSSPIHDEFIWDDSVAAAKYRLIRARALIRSIKVTTTFNRGEVRTISVTQVSQEEVAKARLKNTVSVFVRDPDKPYNQQGYTSVHNLVNEEDSARAVMRAEISRVMSCLQRAQAFADFFDMASEVQEIASRAKALADRIDSAEYKKPDQEGDEAA